MSVDIVQEWVKKAEEDFLSANYLIRKKTHTPFDVVCFLSQQSVEKYMKAYLVQLKKPFSKTHDLLELLKAFESDKGGLELFRDLFVRLGEYAVQFRYPGEEADRKEAKIALLDASEIRKFIRQKMRIR